MERVKVPRGEGKCKEGPLEINLGTLLVHLAPLLLLFRLMWVPFATLLVVTCTLLVSFYNLGLPLAILLFAFGIIFGRSGVQLHLCQSNEPTVMPFDPLVTDDLDHPFC